VTLRAFRLVGEGAAAALDLLHVHADVRGALEEDGCVTVWLASGLPRVELASVRVEELPAERANAVATGLEADAPIRVAADLLVRPPWVARPADFNGIELVVPRGMAFGSGEHASTQAALRSIHAAWTSPASFADVGTGSGILALYASVRGCPRVSACDVDAAAVAAAKALLPDAVVVLGGPEALPEADFVAANLGADELHAVLPALLRRWTGRAALVLAGMRAHEVDGVRRRLPGGASALAVGDFTALTCPARQP
jgi:ribosomal protein L11 methylase PrmA